MINFFENAYKVSVKEDSCEDCGSNLLQVDFSKVRTSQKIKTRPEKVPTLIKIFIEQFNKRTIN